MKQSLDIILDKGTTAQMVCDHLKNYRNITCKAVGEHQVLVTYNSKRIVAKRILKMIQHANRSGKRERNILSVREVTNPINQIESNVESIRA